MLDQKEKDRIRSRRYYAKNRERCLEYSKTHRNPEKKKVYDKEYLSKNKDAIHSAHKAYRTIHREKLNAKTRVWYAKNKDRVKDYRLSRLYKITLKQWEVFLRKQEYCCAICGRLFFKDDVGLPHVDHNHKTNEVRGLLCSTCNIVLGHCEKVNPGFLNQAQSYLSGGVL